MASKVVFQNHPYTEEERKTPFLITRKEMVPFIFRTLKKRGWIIAILAICI